MDRTELIIDDKGIFVDSMRRAWQAEVGDSLQAVRRLKQKHSALSEEKDNLVRSMAKNPEIAGDIKASIVNIKNEIESVEVQIVQAENIEDDFEEFIKFSLDYVEHLKDNWWSAEDPEDRIRLKELLYLDGLAVFRDGKVRTPKLSPIYRYRTSKKTPVDVNFSQNTLTGGPSGIRTQDTRLKRPLL